MSDEVVPLCCEGSMERTSARNYATGADFACGAGTRSWTARPCLIDPSRCVQIAGPSTAGQCQDGGARGRLRQMGRRHFSRELQCYRPSARGRLHLSPRRSAQDDVKKRDNRSVPLFPIKGRSHGAAF
jgi:hypothetical protein